MCLSLLWTFGAAFMITVKLAAAGLAIAMCVYLGFSTQTGQPAPPPADLNSKAPPVTSNSKKVERGDKIGEKTFPDGGTHQFGKVQRGVKVYHAFRVVNTSEVPLRILSVSLS
jgi:hypothetical protein